jgi:hypothetical protein
MFQWLDNLFKYKPLFKVGDIIMDWDSPEKLEILKVMNCRYEYKYQRIGVICSYDCEYIDSHYIKVANKKPVGGSK